MSAHMRNYKYERNISGNMINCKYERKYKWSKNLSDYKCGYIRGQQM